MPVKIMERFVYYPIGFVILFLVLFTKFKDAGIVAYLGELVFSMYDIAKNDYGLNISRLTFVGIFGFFTGYIYGCFSMIVKIRQLNGIIIQVLLGGFKFIFSIISLPYGFLAFFIELMIMPLVLLSMKKYKKKQKQKRDKELLNLMKQAIREEMNPAPSPPLPFKEDNMIKEDKAVTKCTNFLKRKVTKYLKA